MVQVVQFPRAISGVGYALACGFKFVTLVTSVRWLSPCKCMTSSMTLLDDRATLGRDVDGTFKTSPGLWVASQSGDFSVSKLCLCSKPWRTQEAFDWSVGQRPLYGSKAIASAVSEMLSSPATLLRVEMVVNCWTQGQLFCPVATRAPWCLSSSLAFTWMSLQLDCH